MQVMARASVPEGAYVQTWRVRSYEAERNGRIGISTVLRYFEAVATEHSAAAGFDPHWYERQQSAWVVRDMSALLGDQPGIGEDIGVATWVADARKVQATREYAIWCQESSRLVARASARWAYVDRVRGQPQRLYPEFFTGFAVLGHHMAPKHLPPAEVSEGPGSESQMLLTARDYETDTQQHINNCVYADWLREGLHLALPASSASDDASPADETPILQPRYYQIEYVRPALAGDELRVATTVHVRGRRGLSAWQEITNASTGGVCVHARSEHLWVGRGKKLKGSQVRPESNSREEV
jgi:acyl-CoA thioesterase FadM